MNSFPLVEAGCKDNLGRPQMPDPILFGTLFNLYGFRKYHFDCNTPKKGLLFQRLNAKKSNADAAAV